MLVMYFFIHIMDLIETDSDAAFVYV